MGHVVNIFTGKCISPLVLKAIGCAYFTENNIKTMVNYTVGVLPKLQYLTKENIYLYKIMETDGYEFSN